MNKDFFIQKYIAKHYPGIQQVLVANLPKALEMLSFEKVDAATGCLPDPARPDSEIMEIPLKPDQHPCIPQDWQEPER
jgi:hypothetical protein